MGLFRCHFCQATETSSENLHTHIVDNHTVSHVDEVEEKQLILSDEAQDTALSTSDVTPIIVEQVGDVQP